MTLAAEVSTEGTEPNPVYGKPDYNAPAPGDAWGRLLFHKVEAN